MDPSTGHPVEPASIPPNNLPSRLSPETPTSSPQNAPDAPAYESPPTPHTEQERNQGGGHEGDSPDEDSADEEEQPYWASFVADDLSPSEEDLKFLEQEVEEKSALDRKLIP